MDKHKPHAENCDGEVTLDSQRNPTGMEGINLEIIPLKKIEVDLEALNIELEALKYHLNYIDILDSLSFLHLSPKFR